MRPLIFLDIDGVLNGHEFDPVAQSTSLNKYCVEVFNRVLKAVDCEIVISSAWRYMILGGAMTVRGFEYMLRTHGVGPLEDRLVGCTREDEYVATRGKQVEHWRWLNKHDGLYVVVDDLSLDIAECGHPFVQTNGQRGISHDNAVRVVELLGGKLEA
jgi:hypothetical protein